jgi:hypothetical protein
MRVVAMTISDSEEYVDFLKRVSLCAVDLESVVLKKPSSPGTVLIRLNRDEEAYQIGSNEVLSAKLGVELTMNSQEVDSSKSAEDPPDCRDEDEDVHIFFEAVFSVEYRLIDGEYPSDEVISGFLSRHIPLHVWPYVRELVSSMTLRMGLPPLMLPLHVWTA